MGAEELANIDSADIPDDPDEDVVAPPPKPADPPEPKTGEKGVAAVESDGGGDKEAPKKVAKKPAAEEEPDEDVDPDAEPPKRTKISDEETYEIDGKEVSGKDLRKERMFHADYSKKRGEEAQAVREAEQKVVEAEGNVKQFRGFWKAITTDPARMRDVLEEHAPEVFKAMLYAVGTEALELEGMSPSEQEKTVRLRDMDRSQRKYDREKGAREASAQREQQTARQKEMAGKYREWVPAAMKEHGVFIEGNEEHNQEMRDLVVDRVKRDYPGNRDYTQEEISAAVGAVAKSRAGKALLSQQGDFDPAELEKVLGKEGTKKFLSYQADKVRGGPAPAASRGGDPPPKPRKEKEKTTLGFLGGLMDE